MGDFHQNGKVATLHHFPTASAENMERILETYAQNRKITLILPSLFSELEQPALSNILDELSKAKFINQIVIGLDRADEEQYRYAQEVFLPSATGPRRFVE